MDVARSIALAADEPRLDALRQRFQTDELALGAVVQAVASADSEQVEFVVSAARLRVYGQLDQGFWYRWMMDMAREPELLDAVVGWTTEDKVFGIQVGQFKVPLSEEFLIAAESIDLVNRSRAVSALAPNRDAGVQLAGQVADLRWSVGAFNGNRSFIANDGGGLLAARLGVAPRLGETHLAMNASAAWSQDENADVGGVPFEGDRRLVGADLRLVQGRLLVAAEVVGGQLRPVAADATNPVGWYGTGGYMLSNKVQVLARIDSYAAAQQSFSHHAVAGMNWWPTEAIELQVNAIVPVDDLGAVGGLTNFQVAF